MKKYVWILLCFSSISLTSQTQGKEFWFNFLGDVIYDDCYIYLVADSNIESSQINISSPSGLFNYSAAIQGGEVKKVGLSVDFMLHIKNFKEDGSIHIVSTEKISVLVLAKKKHQSDATSIIPIEAIPSRAEYMVMDNGQSGNTQFSVLPTEDLQVKITFSQNSLEGYLANTSYIFNLQKGKIRFFRGRNTLAGTRTQVLDSVGKVVVINGEACGVSRCGPCDQLFEMALPTAQLGLHYILTPFDLQKKGYDFRIASIFPNTQIKINGNKLLELVDVGDSYFGEVDSSVAIHIEASRPIAVEQFMTGSFCNNTLYGDPSMVAINANHQKVQKGKLFTLDEFNLWMHFVNVVVSKSGILSFYMDGNLIDANRFKKVHD